jgi:phospho-N-acetylmuramoyl-pentapeptide-transferase
MAALTAFLICIIFGPAIIEGLRRLKLGQYVRTDHMDQLKDHNKTKQGVPTMGGLLVLISVLISSILWCRLDNDFVILVLGGMVWLGILGFIDDYLKIVEKNAKGMSGKAKLIGQTVLAIIVGLFIMNKVGTELYIPFIKNAVLNLGVLYILFTWFVIVGASNAVNLTDGLDGLAIGCTIFVALTYSVFAYITGNAVVAKYLQIFYLPGAGELSCLCAALVGAGLGFLWFNSYPANVFMGDTGSLAIGGTLAIVSVVLKKEILLVIVGGIFVIESLSVMLQVLSYKLTGKRIFLMSPIHHHFQIKGWPESKITVRFWIIAAILALVGIASLKLI